jgi:uncharacterized protein (DUF3820 family)
MKNAGYFISTGDKNGFYTLRKMEIESSVDSDGMPYSKEKEIYFQNLSTDRAEALAKAKEITGYDLEVGFDLTTIARLKEEEYARLRALRAEYLANFDASVFDGGKYDGRKIAEIFIEDEQYVRWYANNGWFSKDEQKLQQATCRALLAPAIAAEQASRDVNRQKLVAVFGEAWLRGFINHNQQTFCHNMALQILGIRFDYRDSWNPAEIQEQAHSLPTGRALDIMLEIKAKDSGRRNSKAYNAALEALEAALAF